jgi:hypothetical protein
MGAGHSQNVGLNSTTTSSLAPYFGNAPPWGFTLQESLDYGNILVPFYLSFLNHEIS